MGRNIQFNDHGEVHEYAVTTKLKVLFGLGRLASLLIGYGVVAGAEAVFAFEITVMDGLVGLWTLLVGLLVSIVVGVMARAVWLSRQGAGFLLTISSDDFTWNLIPSNWWELVRVVTVPVGAGAAAVVLDYSLLKMISITVAVVTVAVSALAIAFVITFAVHWYHSDRALR